MKEAWEDIQEYEGYYQISNLGSVRSVDRVDTNGSNRKGVLLKQQISSFNYMRVCLCKGGIKVKLTVHVLVAKAFISNMEGKTQVNHINGIKGDNRVENLEWVTPAENIRHSLDTGLKVPLKGEQVGTNKYSEDLVINIKNHIKNGYRNTDIVKLLGVPKQLISDIRNEKSWNHVKV